MKYESFSTGDRVKHIQYGKGTVLDVPGVGYVVKFDDGKTRRITDGRLLKRIRGKNMKKKFKHGDRVYHKNLNQYGYFIDYAWESDEECDVNFETEDGRTEQKHVSLNMLELACKTYNQRIMEALRQRRELDANDISQDTEIMRMAKQDVFNEYCQWEGLLDGYGYDLLNIIEDVYDINLQQ